MSEFSQQVKKMFVYKKRITITDPNNLVLSDLPFQPGQQVEVVILGVDKERIALVQELRDLFKENTINALEIENTIDELKTHLLGRKTPIRSLKPREVVQEIYGWLLGHYAVRCLMFTAAQQAGISPLRST